MGTNIDSHHDPRAGVRRRAQLDLAARGDGAGKRADDAITNLSTYALRLDFEYHRLHDRLLELTKGEGAAPEELRTALRERDELGAAREAFRRSVAALHDLSRSETRAVRSDQP
jgi:hypothetical protein